MSIPAVSYSFTNGTTADATQVNQNFQDLINGMTDGTRDFSVGSLAVAGAVTLNGAVTLGNGTIDDVIISGSLASSIAIKTNNLYDIGSATLGLASIYYGSAGGFTTRLLGGATASWSLTLPPTSGTAGYSLQNNGSGVTSWVPSSVNINSNYSLTTSVGANAMTIALKTNAGSDATALDPVTISFRSATAATSTVVLRQVTAALSMTIASGATLGLPSGADAYVYWYALDNAGTVELAVSGSWAFDEGSVQSTTGISGASTSNSVLYSTTSRTNVAIRYLGRFKSNQTVSGTYTATATEISTITSRALYPRSEVWVYGTGATDYGSTNTKIRRFGTAGKNVGTGITYADSATNGASFIANFEGLYSISYTDRFTAGEFAGISVNSTQLTTDINTITAADRRCSFASAGTESAGLCLILQLNPGDVVRAHTRATSANADTTAIHFRITLLN